MAVGTDIDLLPRSFPCVDALVVVGIVVGIVVFVVVQVQAHAA